MRQDLRYAIRTLLKNRGFTLIAVLTLALGIGANTAIFSVVNAVLLRPLPYKEPGRLFFLTTDRQDSKAPTSLENFEAWKARSSVFEDMAIFYRNTGWSRVTLTGTEDPEQVSGGFVSANLFPLLGVAPRIGRVFTAEEESRREQVVILSDALWKRRFGASSGAIGREVEINGASFQVIGVMPATFQFPARETQFWAPITTNRYWLDRPAWDNLHGSGFFLRWNVIARLKLGVDPRRAQSEMTAIAKSLEQETPQMNQGLGAWLSPVRVELNPSARVGLLLLMGAVSFVLLIACSNVANLMLARGARREREMAIRTALGAGRTRLVRQLLTESSLLGILSGGVGLLLALFGAKALIAFGPRDIPRLEQAGIDAGMLGFTLLLSVCAAMLFGLIPAWKTSTPNQSMKPAGSKRVRSLLVIFEFALSVILLTGAGLLIRSFLAIESVDPGFRPEHVVTMRVVTPRANFYDQLLERIRALPGVVAAGGINGLFESPDSQNFALRAVEGHEAEPKRRWSPLTWTGIGGDYLQAMGARLLRGRFFNQRDSADSPLVAIIDESLARRYWPGEDPIGKRFKGFDKRGKNDDWITVIGVVQDMRRQGLENQSASHIFYKETMTPDLVVRTAADPSQLAAALRTTVRTLDKTAVIQSISTLQQQLSDQLSPRRFQTGLLTLFSAIALVLASVGIYGFMHYSVAQRTKEIGIRMALGARTSRILSMVLHEGLSLAVIGLCIGLLGSYWLTSTLRTFLYGITATDPFTLSIVSSLLVLVALLATFVPAWTASRVDPLIALRTE